MKLAVLAVLLASSPAIADDGDSTNDGTYLAPHPDTFWWASGQVNVITQAQPGFHSPYEGPHSLRPDDYLATSIVGTAFGGVEVTKTTALVLAFESAGGGGLSDALGVAGFTNLDVVRNPTLGPAPYIGRAFLDQVVPLSDTYEPADRNALHVLRKLPTRRLEIRAGKMSTVDVFDVNSGATDSHFQFMNWTIDNNGAYDYAADTRGYTLGGVVEYAAPQWAVRYGAFLMPTIANGIKYDWDLANARGENLEVEVHGCIAGRPGILRGLAFWNHANMGVYDEAIAVYRVMPDVMPNIEATRVPGRVKYGFGLNGEQEVLDELHVFGRIGWNEGKKESFAYTEVDNTILVGADLRGGRWSRPHDKLGVAAVTNGISESHREYLRIGGNGFLLGDGTLHYGREDIVEAYYTARAYRGIFPALDVQLIDHPGYNTDRGPVVVGSFRLHVEI